MKKKVELREKWDGMGLGFKRARNPSTLGEGGGGRTNNDGWDRTSIVTVIEGGGERGERGGTRRLTAYPSFRLLCLLISPSALTPFPPLLYYFSFTFSGMGGERERAWL